MTTNAEEVLSQAKRTDARERMYQERQKISL